VPLYLLYEVSILVASLLGRSHAASGGEETAVSGSQLPAERDPADPSVQQIIDHTDPDLSG
jgi:hypothetical protein